MGNRNLICYHTLQGDQMRKLSIVALGLIGGAFLSNALRETRAHACDPETPPQLYMNSVTGPDADVAFWKAMEGGFVESVDGTSAEGSLRGRALEISVTRR